MFDKINSGTVNSGTAEHIEIWPLDRLIPSARNARTHSETQIAEIAGSITAFGFIVPLIVDAKGNIIAGHGRVLAARMLKLARIPVIIIDHLSESEKRAYAIADNKIALNAGWNDELLKIELSALAAEGVALSDLGFAEEELRELLAGLESERGDVDEETVPDALPEPTTAAGQVWRLGEHRLLCGDATEADAYRTVLEGKSADMVFSDPPYNVDYRSARAGSPTDRAIANDNLGDGFGDFLLAACQHLLAFTTGSHYICMSSSELHTLYHAFTRAGGHWSTFVIWGKSSFTLGRSDYQRQYEPILYGWREGASHHWCGARDQGDLWLVDKPRLNDLHPTMKPVALIERAIHNSSRRGDLVLDPFGGSGSTLIACEKTARKARLIELDASYCDVIVRRWQDFTGKQATCAASGRTFDELSAEHPAITALALTNDSNQILPELV